MLRNVLTYLDETVMRVPGKTAFANETESFSFRDVYEMSRSVGTFIHRQGIRSEPVAVFMDKHPKTIIAFLGVISAGCCYVPIDAQMPAGRINLILENCAPQLMICDPRSYERALTLSFSGRIVLFDDMVQTAPDDASLARIREQALDIDPIYIVFTSGSTGVPKGVAACHRSVIDYIEQLSETLGFDENTVFANQTPLYFDACLKEIYPTLKFGATTYLVPKEYFTYPLQLVEFLNRYRINTICWVVSALTMISSFGTFDTLKPQYLHTIAFGSEVFPRKQFDIWRKALPDASFTNLYGPTEGTGMCCYFHCDREMEEDEPIPIGRPFANTQILLLDADNRPAQEGEICIRGTGVTLGYYNDPEKTAAAYVQNPLNRAYPEIIYRTGDMARYNTHGELVFMARADDQIKHMGHRIELGEIEAAANAADAVRMCACVYDREKEKIVLYYVGECRAGELITFLKERLQRYMVPNVIRQIDRMPFTANGKLDRKTLLKQYQEGRRAARGGRKHG